ncbi:MAG: hypothetical protein ACK4GL_10655 [Flavobacteriales bacterium]
MNQDSNNKGAKPQSDKEEIKQKYKRRSYFLRKENARMKFYLYAAIIIFMASLGANLIISMKYNELSKENDDLLATRKKITADYATLRDQYDDLFQQFSMLTNPSVKAITLQAAENGFDALVYYNQSNGAIILNVSNFPDSEPATNYLLEVIDRNGERHELGTVESIGRTSILKIMLPVQNANRFVIYRNTPSSATHSQVMCEGAINS